MAQTAHRIDGRSQVMGGALPIFRGLGGLAFPRLRPIKLTVLVTFMCQSRCNHCDIWKFYYRGEAREKLRAEMSVDDYRRLFKAVARSLIWIEIAGGEPTMRNDFPQIVSSAYELTNIQAAAVTTNGLNTRRVVNQVKEVLKRSGGKGLTVGVSVDGDEAGYARVRGVDSFHTVMSTFDQLREVSNAYPNLRPHLAYTISRFNAGEFNSFFKKVSREYNLSIDDFSFTFEHFVGFYFASGSKLPESTTADFQRLLLQDVESIQSYRRKSSSSRKVDPRRLFYDYYLSHVASYVGNRDHQVIPCTASKLSAFVDPYGNVQPCSMWNRVIGNVKKESFEQIWDSGQNLEARREIVDEKCPNCWTPCEAQPTWLGNLPRTLLG